MPPMKRPVPDFKPLVFVVAASGFTISLTTHVLYLVGYEIPSALTMTLFVGIFVVWLPTVFEVSALKSDRSWAGLWKMLEPAPLWLRLLAAAAMVYATANFFLTTGSAFGRVTDQNPGFARIATGHALAFYSGSMALMAASRERERRAAAARTVIEARRAPPGGV
jgi:hypothetical protein